MFRVTTLDPKDPPLNRGERGRFQPGLFRPRDQPDRVRPAQRRGLLPGLQPRLHLRPHLPRREFQHPAPRLRILDDRAGDRLRRPRRRHGPGRGHAEIRHPLRPGARAPGDGVLQPLHRHLAAAAPAPRPGCELRARDLHPGRRAAAEGRREIQLPPRMGQGPADRARALPERKDLPEARLRHRLPQGDQGLLHAPERRRPHRRRHGPAGPRRRRDHRRQPARGALRHPEGADRRHGAEERGLRMVPQPCASSAAPRTPASAWASSGRSCT